MNQTIIKSARAAALSATLLVVAGCGDDDAAIGAADATSSQNVALPTEPASSGAAREVFQIDSMQSLIDQSDLVILGYATAVVPGRNAGHDVGGRLGFRDVTVEVQQVLHGNYTADTLTLEELGWKEGEPFTINEAAWAAPGDTMLMGLKATPNGSTEAGPRYILTSSATRFFLESDGDVQTNYLNPREAGPFVAEAASLSVEQIVAAAKEASR